MQAFILGLPTAEFWALTLGAGGFSVGLIVLCFVRLQQARLLEDTPTSLVRSAAQGYVELCGHARLMPGPPIVSPLSLTRCVWWRYSVQELQRKGDKQQWVTIDKGTSGELFLLCDPTGECVIDPDGAKVIPSVKRNWRGPTPKPNRGPDGSWLQFGDYRYFEELLLVGDPLYSIGWFRTQGVEQTFDESQDVRTLLAEWKKDPQELLKRFDANGDGQIDLQEWEQARRAAVQQVRDDTAERALHPELHLMGKPADRRPYILSSVTQNALTRRKRLWALLWLALAVLLAYYTMLSLHLRS